MKVVILAGGRGKRLGRPDIPKPMVELSGTPLLEKLIKQLVSFGIFDLYITVGYKRHIIENYFGDGTEFNCKVTYLCEESPLGTAGSVIKTNIFLMSHFWLFMAIYFLISIGKTLLK